MLFEMKEAATSSIKSNDEWYTPHEYIKAARNVMGTIDLDPASCAVANDIVQATTYYTKEQDGLQLPFYGCVWCNPPYSKINNKSGIGQWVAKLISEYSQGNVGEAILLVTVRTEATWFRDLWQFPICFTARYIHFYKPDGNNIPLQDSRAGHFFGTSFVYLGPNIQKFVEHFTEFGPVVTPDGVHRRPAPIAQPTLWDMEVHNA